MSNTKGQNLWRDDVVISNEDGTKTIIPTWFFIMPCNQHSEIGSAIVKISLKPYRFSMTTSCVHRVGLGKAKTDLFKSFLSNEEDAPCKNKKCPLCDMM